MGFLDKVKDLFTDEEEIIETEEIEVEENEEHKLPTFMRNKIEEEQKREEKKKQREEESKVDIISEREVVKTRSNNNFSFPMDLDENDMIPDIGYSKQNVLQQEREKEKTLADLYAKKEEPKPKKFRPTPVISPIYGILDKNYTKDEVKVQDENSYEIQRTPRKVDFESVRNKAFGSLTDDIKNAMCENCELYQEVKIIKNANKKANKKDVLLTDMIEEQPIEPKEDITIEDAADNYFDFGVAYEPPKKEEKPVINVEEAVVNNEIKIINHNAEESTAEKIEVKEEKKNQKKEEPKVELTETDLLEDTKEFDKITSDEESINSILGSDDDIPLSAENDIFDLMDSIYDEEDR